MISEFPLFIFTTLGGIAAGSYVARAIAPLPQGRKAPWAFALASLVLLAVSGIALLGHLGQPLRVLNAFSNPTAGITQEGIATVLFGIAVLADLVLCAKQGDSPRWLVALAAVFGVALTVVMGLAYAGLPGTPAWASAATAPFFVVGDLAMGAGWYVLFRSDALSRQTYRIYAAAIMAVGAACVAAMGAHFASLGFSVVPFVAGAIGAVIAAACYLLGDKRSSKTFAWCACACVIIGVAVARYAFYIGSII